MLSNSVSNRQSDNVLSQDDHDKSSTGARFKAKQKGSSQNNSGRQSSVNHLKDAFIRQFSKNAAAKDAFHQLMRQTFSQIVDPETPGSAPKYNYNKAETLRQQAVKGDLSWLPEVEVLSNSEFSKAQFNGQQPSSTGTALGAFGDDTIMLNESVLSDSGLALRVYAEEAGHALDKVLNQEVDSAGDEGAIFQKLLSGEKISAEQMTALKAENDHGVLTGKNVEFDTTVISTEGAASYAQQQLIDRAYFVRDNPHFDLSIYLRYDDMQGAYNYDSRAGGTEGQVRGLVGLFDHWAKHGVNEGRRASLEFDPAYYIKQNPDLKGKTPREVYTHWRAEGIKNGLQGSEDFDISFYLSKYRGQIKAYAKENPVSDDVAKLTTQTEKDNYAAFVHWRAVGRKQGLIGTLKSDIKANIFAVAYKNVTEGVEGASERFATLRQASSSNDRAALKTAGEAIYKLNQGMNKAQLDRAVINITRAGAKSHFMSDIKYIVAVGAANEARGVKGAKALNETLKGYLAEGDGVGVNKTASDIFSQIEDPQATVEWINGVTHQHSKNAYKVKDKAKVDANAAAFTVSTTRTKLEAHIMSDIKHIVALAAHNDKALNIKGAKALNETLKQAIFAKDPQAINDVASKIIAQRKGLNINIKWIDNDLKDWYAKQTFADKTKVDTHAAVFTNQSKAKAHFMSDVRHILAAAAANEARGVKGAKALNDTLKKGIADKDAVAVNEVSTEILKQSQARLGPKFNVAWINGITSWYENKYESDDKAKMDAATDIYSERPKAIVHIMANINHLVALAAHSEFSELNGAKGLEGAKALNDTLKESIKNRDTQAINEVASKIIAQRKGKEINVEWIDGALTDWYAKQKFDDKTVVNHHARLYTDRINVEKHLKSDIGHIVALAAHGEANNLKGAKALNDTLKKSIEDKDTQAINEVSTKIIATRKQPYITPEWIDGGLTNWYSNFKATDKVKVDADVIALKIDNTDKIAAAQKDKARVEYIGKNLIAVAYQDFAGGEEGAEARWTKLEAAIENKGLDGGAALKEVSKDIFALNKDMSIAEVDQAIVEYTKVEPEPTKVELAKTGGATQKEGTKANGASNEVSIAEELKQSFQSSFAAIAKNSTAFHKLLSQAFGSNYNHDMAEQIRKDTDFSWLPQTKLVDSLKFANVTQGGVNVDKGALMGAYDGETVLLNKAVLSDSALAQKVYAEEVGHALDKALNKGADSAGDEGAIFQKLLSGEKISPAQMTALRAENDHGKFEGADVEFFYDDGGYDDGSSTFFDDISTFFDDAGTALSSAFDDAGNWAGQAWDGIDGFIDDAFGATSDWTIDFGDDFFTDLGGFGDDILNGLDEFGSDIAEFGTDLFNDIGEFGDDLFTDLGQFGTEFLKDIGGIGTDIFNGITDIDGGDILDSIVKFGEGIVEDVKGFGKTIFGTIDDVIIEPVGNFGDKVAEGAEDLVKLVDTNPFATTSVKDGLQVVAGPGFKLKVEVKYENRKDIVHKTAEEVNKEFVGDNPKLKGPYKSGNRVAEYSTIHADQWVRAHGEKNQVSSWMMREEAIKGLSAKQIQQKYSLEFEPIYISDVNVPADSRIRTGIVASNFGGGEGARQYQWLGIVPKDAVTDRRPIN